ncbi:molybdopterin-guanine dinucleotide biosynthesis protein B [Aurantivibrio infirmus]
MKVFGIIGWKNSGKTTLISKIISELSERNLSVATIKHAHHEFDIDHPGKDSFQHRQAGANQVLVASHRRWALMHEIEDNEKEPSLACLLSKLDPVDIVIVEGFKLSDHPKLVVVRQQNNLEPLPDQAQPIVAIATDAQINKQDYNCNGPVFSLGDVSSICDFILDNARHE